jgi:hypothetical protein
VNILFSHRLYPDFSGSTKREASATEIPEYRQHFDFMKQHHCSISIVGHRHIFFGFTEEKIEKLALDKSYLYENLYGFGVPSVANGTYPNGVVLFDTETKMIQ